MGGAFCVLRKYVKRGNLPKKFEIRGGCFSVAKICPTYSAKICSPYSDFEAIASSSKLKSQYFAIVLLPILFVKYLSLGFMLPKI